MSTNGESPHKRRDAREHGGFLEDGETINNYGWELEHCLDNELRLDMEPNRNLRGKSYFDAISQVVDKGSKLTLPTADDVDHLSWLDWTFEYLAMKNKYTNLDIRINIPDTVVLKHQRPYAWFTSDDHSLRKKTRVQDLTPEVILKNFRKNAQPGQIIAYFIALKYNSQGHEVPSIEYFDDQTLEHFLFNRMKNVQEAGVLQKFVEPPGNRNTMVRVWWTPHKVMVEMRFNRNNLYSTSIPLRDRAVTFDGEEHHSDQRNISSGKLYKRIKEKAEAIIEHVESLLPHGYRTWQTVFYFKLGANSKLWWLWSGSVRLVNKNGPVLNVHRPVTPKSDKINRREPSAEIPTKLAALSNGFRCIVCRHSLGDSKQKYTISYRTLLQHFYPELLNTDSAPPPLEYYTRDMKASSPDTSLIKNFRKRSIQMGDPKAMASRDLMVLKVIVKNCDKPIPRQIMPFLYDETFVGRTIDVCESCSLSISTSATNSMLDFSGLFPKAKKKSSAQRMLTSSPAALDESSVFNRLYKKPEPKDSMAATLPAPSSQPSLPKVRTSTSPSRLRAAPQQRTTHSAMGMLAQDEDSGAYELAHLGTSLADISSGFARDPDYQVFPPRCRSTPLLSLQHSPYWHRTSKATRRSVPKSLQRKQYGGQRDAYGAALDQSVEHLLSKFDEYDARFAKGGAAGPAGGQQAGRAAMKKTFKASGNTLEELERLEDEETRLIKGTLAHESYSSDDYSDDIEDEV